MVGGVFAQMGESSALVSSASSARADLAGLPPSAVMVLYTALFVEFCVRYKLDRPVRRLRPFAFLVRRKDAQAGQPAEPSTAVLAPRDVSRVKLQLVAIAGSTLLIFIRSIYRCELSPSPAHSPPLFTHQVMYRHRAAGRLEGPHHHRPAAL